VYSFTPVGVSANDANPNCGLFGSPIKPLNTVPESGSIVVRSAKNVTDCLLDDMAKLALEVNVSPK